MTKRVLIIEDDVTQCQGLCRLLGRRHLDSECAHTLHEGIEAFRSGDFACIVLDLGLPDSPDCLTTATSIPDFSPIPVIVLTGSDDKILFRECVSRGAEFVIKGSDSIEVMALVLKAVERSNPSPEVETEYMANENERRQRDRSSKKEVLLPFVPLLSLALAVIIASLTGGAFLYRSISDQSRRDESTASHFQVLDKLTQDAVQQLLGLTKSMIDLSNKVSIGEQDRAAIRREEAIASTNQEGYRNDVLRRLERIEEMQLSLIKDRNAR